jgi:hypothetical protein
MTAASGRWLQAIKRSTHLIVADTRGIAGKERVGAAASHGLDLKVVDSIDE